MARKVAKTFEAADGGVVEALQPITLAVRPGETVSVIGPSGCGKTTLLMILAGLEPSTGGEVFVDGEPIVEPCDGLGIVFQSDLLLPWKTVIDNVLVSVELRGWSRKEYRERASELIDLVGLTSFRDRYPRELSGGMRQRVAIARALVTEPRVLLMDEPFGALDALTREQMTDDVRAICEGVGVTSVLVTHSIEEAVFMGDKVAVLSPNPGRLVAIEEISLGAHRPAALRRDGNFAEQAMQVREVFEKYGVLR